VLFKLVVSGLAYYNFSAGQPHRPVDCLRGASLLRCQRRTDWSAMKYKIPEMLKQGGAAIALAGVSAYNAAKHGMVGLTKTAAFEFAQENIRVNCVCPGFIRTAMTERAMDKALVLESEMIASEPIGRLGKPEIAAGVLWLLSDAASFVTGHSLTIDGGWTAR
jgi:NAD(P)-dependent dehydrogenase (short-subunit alcohol dehydrogenase family)